MDDMNNITWRK